MDVYLQLAPRATVVTGGGLVRVRVGDRVVVESGDEPPAAYQTLDALARAPATGHALNARALADGDAVSLLRWQRLLALCLDRQLIEYRVEIDGAWLATVEPCRPDVEPPRASTRPVRTRRLSRFAYLRRVADRMRLESPHAAAHLAVGPAAMAILAGTPAAGDPASAALAALLDQYGFLEPPGEASPASTVWEFHDALFHHASRLRAGVASGATYRMRDRMPPWPAVREGGGGARIALAVPDASVMAADPPFSVVAARRRSVREAHAVLSLDDLSAFLYRTLRVGAVERGELTDTARRAVPSGGGLHPLEAYLAVGRCDGLPAGCYWYDAHRHQLETLGHDEARLRALLDQAARSWGRAYPPPDVLITLAARVPRVAWKYEGNAYRVILLDAGVVVQMMYLVATALGLSPCAVGNGDPALFAALSGCDPLEETSVAEFALSGRAAPDRS